MNYTNDHVWIDIGMHYPTTINNQTYVECKYCKISKLNYYIAEYPKCLSQEEKIIKDIIE